MTLLNEEVEEMHKEGDLLLTMDGNAKLGLLGEEISRNGHELIKVLNNTHLTILNGTEKCEGTITRQNTRNENEKSAIDFIVYKWVNKIKID